MQLYLSIMCFYCNGKLKKINNFEFFYLLSDKLLHEFD